LTSTELRLLATPIGRWALLQQLLGSNTAGEAAGRRAELLAGVAACVHEGPLGRDGLDGVLVARAVADPV